MLSPTDTHYLIGLLTRASDGNDVEIELGDMVFDDAAEKERDVDITVTRKNADGSTEMYRGIEVKDHTKPLDVIHVEQLCAKMADMPALTHKAIVSASGYTKPAILKAQKKGVDLLEIVPWDDTTEGFEPIRTAQENWHFMDARIENNTNITFNVDPEKLDAFRTAIATGHPTVCYADSEPIPNMPNMKALAEGISNSAINQWLATEEGKKMPGNFTATVDFNVGMDLDLKGKPCVLVNGERITLDSAHITGTIQRTEVRRAGEFKMLRRVGDTAPICCCIIYETRDEHLSGMSMSNVDEMSRPFFIPYNARIKKKIYKEKLN